MSPSALSKCVDAAAAAAAPPPSAAGHADRVAAASAALAAERENVASLRADAARLRKHADAASTDGALLDAAVAKARAEAAAEEPKLRNQLALLANVTQLHIRAHCLPARFVATLDGPDATGLVKVDVPLPADGESAADVATVDQVWRVINAADRK